MTANGYLAGDPTKLNKTGYAKGDIVAADVTGTLTVLAIGSNTEVLTVDTTDPQDLDYLPAGGGGGTPSGTVVTEQAFGQASTAGVAATFSRGDHTHGTMAAPSIPAAGGTVVAETTFGQASTAGVGAAFSRSDHTHGTPAAPTIPTASGSVVSETSFGQSTVVGVAATFSRGDHSHGSPAAPSIPSAAGTVSAETTFGIASNAGAAATFSRGDHTHGSPTAPVIPAAAGSVVSETTYGQATVVGVATTFSRGDHSHGSPALTTPAAIGAATKIVMRQAYVTSGDITPFPNTGGAWAKLTGIAELLIPAVAGDYVEITVNGLRASGNTFVDVAVLTGGGPTIARYLLNGTNTPNTEGNPGWYTDAGFISYRGPQGFVVAAGDLDTGNVRFAIVCKTSAAIGTFFASTNYPFYWRAFNFGPVA